MQPDYLIIGSGLSALTFGALMANTGKTVQILEAYEHPGGFGHTFTMAKKYTFNAQFYYVWDCGEGQTVNRVLKRLGLDREVTFERYDPNGFDHMRMPGYKLDIPSDPEILIQRLSTLFPDHTNGIRQFVNEVEKTGAGLKTLAPPIDPVALLKQPQAVFSAVCNLNSTLQDVFDKFQLPQAAQTLLALQWLDFLLPPNQLSFFAWVALFRCTEILESGVLEFPTAFTDFIVLMKELDVELEPVNVGSGIFYHHGDRFLSSVTTNNNLSGIDRTIEHLRFDTL
jgi:all-trans-retinol 13,14-reductase